MVLAVWADGTEFEVPGLPYDPMYTKTPDSVMPTTPDDEPAAAPTTTPTAKGKRGSNGFILFRNEVRDTIRPNVTPDVRAA